MLGAFLAALGATSPDATSAVVRTLPLGEPLAGALTAMLEDRGLLFVAGLLTGLWLRHEHRRPPPKLPYPYLEIRKGVSRVPPDDQPLELP